MKQIYVLVEGHSEREFVTRIMGPYFGQEGILIRPIPMRKSGGGFGISNLEHFKNHIKPLLHNKDVPAVTTFIDLFRFPVQSSEHAEEEMLKKHSENPDIEMRIKGFEDVLQGAVQKIKPYDHFIPYIQKHEFEALLFSDASAFIEHAGIQKDIERVLKAIPNPEDINTTETGHPAKRLESIYAAHKKKYSKGADAVNLAEMAGIKIILEKCPRFRAWIELLIATAKG